jgi:GNAT superfamily N-acetyltransferase
LVAWAMGLSVRQATLAEISFLRDQYRAEMSCQIIHDSIHTRDGWTREYLVDLAGEPVAYGSVAVSGPWKNTPTLYEFHVVPRYRVRLFECFENLLTACGAHAIETQTNDKLLSLMLYSHCDSIRVESILFEKGQATDHEVSGGLLRRVVQKDAESLEQVKLDSSCAWLLEVRGQPVAAGGVLYHYNKPYGDIYMEVAEPFRRKGYGAFFVQQLKAICRAEGTIPAARCNIANVASRKTLQRAGFVPCGCIVVGTVRP